MHPSVRALIEASGVANTSGEEAIRIAARALADRALAMGWEGPPFNMDVLASTLGLHVDRSYDFADDQDACVMVRRVLVNGRKPRVRQRSSVAHEVVHTIFPDYGTELARVGVLWRREGDDSEVERLCQTGAAELLLPFAAFMPRLAHLGVSLETVVSLADLFDASVETTARRVVEVSTEPLVMLMVKPKVDPPLTREYAGGNGCVHDPRAELLVAYACTGEACSAIRIATGTKLPPRSAAERAWKRVSLAGKSVVIQRAVENWANIGELGSCSCEALTLPKGSTTPCEIVCLIRLGESPVRSPTGRIG